jgi:hypothetical protein
MGGRKMADRKDPEKRARRNKDLTPVSKVTFVLGKKPKLPRLFDGRTVNGKPAIMKWNQRTLDWWEKWGDSPQAIHFMDTDWEFLLATALIHHKFWGGDLTLAGELRIREAKFGATMEDRARLRIQYAAVEEAEAKNKKKTEKPETRYGDLKAVEAPKATA